MIAIRQRGGIPPWITEQTKQAIASMLANPTTTITSCVELLAWVHKNHQSNTSDQVLYKHCRKHHNSTLKVSRKSHYKKDKDAERTFKPDFWVEIRPKPLPGLKKVPFPTVTLMDTLCSDQYQ
ncbi:MAG: hypothetical protein OXC03_11220 [Flavobacteriaceae bacterium]|nr:hypothetical protein [Flavobacteriaceae bacterium]